jgi:hypothetical protein
VRGERTAPASVSRSILPDLTAATVAPTGEDLATVVRQTAALGFTECIAYAWAGGVVQRTPEALLGFVLDVLPDLRRELT